MSKQLLDSVSLFLQGITPLPAFIDEYVDAWRCERDSGATLEDDPITSEKLSSIFCAIDMYNPSGDREEYEFDENRLRFEIQKIFDGEGIG